MANIKTLFNVTVPQYLLITIFSSLAISMTLNQEIGIEVIMVIISLSFAMFGLNSSNQFFESELDAINKPLRPIPAKTITKKGLMSVFTIFFIISILIAFFVNKIFLFLIIAYILFSFPYSIPQINLKKIYFGSNIFGSVFHSVIPYLSIWSLKQGPLELHFFYFYTALIFFIATTKDYEDFAGDRKKNICTAPVILGIEKSKLFIIVGLFISITAMAILLFYNILDFYFIIPITSSYLVLFYISKKLFTKYIEVNITQSKLVTHSVILIVLIQLLFGITNRLV